MGWKEKDFVPQIETLRVAIRFRWIWVGRSNNARSWNSYLVAIRFRWIWVGRQLFCSPDLFAISRNPLSLDMGWKTGHFAGDSWLQCRNPLSLDMGWKGCKFLLACCPLWSQSAFAGYGLEANEIMS